MVECLGFGFGLIGVVGEGLVLCLILGLGPVGVVGEGLGAGARALDMSALWVKTFNVCKLWVMAFPTVEF